MDHDLDTQSAPPPVLIVGAGVGGLLLAQHLRKQGVPFEIFERDAGGTSTKGVGWGLTLHWSLPALRSLLPEDLVRRLPEAYVDRAAVVEQGLTSAFPFFDLSTGQLRAATPAAPESHRIRVSRERFRRVLATGLDIQWGKTATDFVSGPGAENSLVTVNFEDGSSRTGRLLVACDGGNSRIRRCLMEQMQKHAEDELQGLQDRYLIPVGVMGFRMECTADQVRPMRELDPFFLQGTASANDSYFYFSILDSPGSPPEKTDNYTCQIVVSWPVRDSFKLLGQSQDSVPGQPRYPDTNEGRLELVKKLAGTWAEPFRSIVGSVPEGTEVRALNLHDWAPPAGFRGSGRVALVGDAFHPMSMYRGEGANHAVLDVADLAELVIGPHIIAQDSPTAELRAALDEYEDRVVDRARPAVLASRRACLDAHEWGRINDNSPLLTRRAPKIDFDESDLP